MNLAFEVAGTQTQSYYVQVEQTFLGIYYTYAFLLEVLEEIKEGRGPRFECSELSF